MPGKRIAVIMLIGIVFLTLVRGESDMIELEINGEVFDVKLENNSATRELVKALENGNVTVDAKEYGGFEKVGIWALPFLQAIRILKPVRETLYCITQT